MSRLFLDMHPAAVGCGGAGLEPAGEWATAQAGGSARATGWGQLGGQQAATTLLPQVDPSSPEGGEPEGWAPEGGAQSGSPEGGTKGWAPEGGAPAGEDIIDGAFDGARGVLAEERVLVAERLENVGHGRCWMKRFRETELEPEEEQRQAEPEEERRGGVKLARTALTAPGGGAGEQPAALDEGEGTMDVIVKSFLVLSNKPGSGVTARGTLAAKPYVALLNDQPMEIAVAGAEAWARAIDFVTENLWVWQLAAGQLNRSDAKEMRVQASAGGAWRADEGGRALTHAELTTVMFYGEKLISVDALFADAALTQRLQQTQVRLVRTNVKQRLANGHGRLAFAAFNRNGDPMHPTDANVRDNDGVHLVLQRGGPRPTATTRARS